MAQDMVKRVLLDGVTGMKAGLTVPDAGEAVGFAPARGPVRVVRDMEVLPGGTRREVGRHLERVDVFDRMHRAAAVSAERAGVVFVAPFSAGQVAMGRHYAGLMERHRGGGMRCASLEAGRAGGSGGGFMDAYLDEGREIALLQRRIGAGAALVLRRVRPSARGEAKAGLILDRRLVDGVCVEGMTVSEVLVGAGWATYGKAREGARVALAASLDRMMGYDAVRGAK